MTLIERLFQVSEQRDNEANRLCLEAADAIQTLQAERDHAMQDSQHWADKHLALQAKLATLEADAERYRWLRDPTTDVSLVLDKRTSWVPPDENVPGVGGYHTYEYRAGDELDAAIDAAKGGPHEDA